MHPAYCVKSHESYQSAAEIDRKIRLFLISIWWVCDGHGKYTAWWNHVQGSHDSEQGICFDSKDLIDRERTAVDLYDQRDSKGQMSFIAFKEGFPKDHLQLARNVLNQLPVKFSANSVAPSNEVWNIGDRIFAQILVKLHALTAIQQLQRYAIVFEDVLALNQHGVVEEATYIPLVCYEASCGPRNSLLYLAVWWEGRLGYRMPSKNSDRTCKLLNIRWLQQSLSCLGLYNRRLNVRQWILCTILRSAPRILW